MQSVLLRGVGVICVKLQTKVMMAVVMAKPSMDFQIRVFLKFFIINIGCSAPASSRARDNSFCKNKTFVSFRQIYCP